MKRINIILIIGLLLSITSCGQVKNTSTQKKTDLLDNKLLLGKWQSEDDAQYMLLFSKEQYSELYGQDTTAKMYYKLSSSCNLKDSSSKLNLKKAFLLFYSDEGSVQQCNEILNLESKILSWMDNSNGKVFVFKKIN